MYRKKLFSVSARGTCAALTVRSMGQRNCSRKSAMGVVSASKTKEGDDVPRMSS
jgi:hypothetical protein